MPSFHCIPILDKMEAIYRMDRNPKRFEEYLSLLQGQSKDDMLLPIAGYNPMGKDHVLEKLLELKRFGAEEIVVEETAKINRGMKSQASPSIGVRINLGDDIGGSWTNRFTTDYASKFDLNALIHRNFCTPYFWTSETYSADLIAIRTREAIFRTLFWVEKGRPGTLHQFFAQEVFVQKRMNHEAKDSSALTFGPVAVFLKQQEHTEDYNLIFNFFYGDEASATLGYSTYGMPPRAGFIYARYQAQSA